MKRRICTMIWLATLALSLSGCLIPAIGLGIWLLDINGDLDSTIGISLVQDGTTFVPNPLPQEADTFLSGTVTWEQNRRTIVFTQVNGDSRIVFAGTLRGNNEIVNGTWMQTAGGSLSGTWTGMRL